MVWVSSVSGGCSFIVSERVLNLSSIDEARMTLAGILRSICFIVLIF